MHRVRSFHWNSGILSVRHVFIESLDEAIKYARELECQSVKIFNELEELVIEIVGELFETYY